MKALLTRRFSTNIRQAITEHKSLMIEEFGEPIDKVKLQIRKPSEVLPENLKPSQLFLEHIAACINPADINLIQGVYGVKPKLPAIVGNEGIVRVRAVGSEITHLKPGDLAVSIFGPNNYWQNFSVAEGHNFAHVNNDLSIEAGVQIKVNPCTAYRMIKDFCSLGKDDVIIQNGANSAVGVYVIQLAKLWGFKTINVIRDKSNKDEVVTELKNYGADVVLTEEEVGQVEKMKPILQDMGKPRLFLNCVGGKNANNCQRHLADRGYSVTYGAMSKQPFYTTASSLIFKNHKFLGFWMQAWYYERENPEGRRAIQSMLDEIGNLFINGKLKPKTSTMISFEERNRAFTESNNTKFVFLINKPST